MSNLKIKNYGNSKRKNVRYQRNIVREKKSLPKTVEKTYETEEIGKNSVLDWIKKYANGEENE